MERTADDHSAAPRTGAGFACVNLAEVHDSAPDFGFDEQGDARFAAEPLGCERTGLSYQCLNPGRRQSFGHRHREDEETYVVLGGSGRVRLDDETLELAPLDAVRVAPETARCFEAGPDGLRLLAFGTRHSGDAEMLPNWWGS